MSGPDDCRYCGGTGKLLVTKGDATSAPIQRKEDCFGCSGTGRAKDQWRGWRRPAPELQKRS